MGELHVVRQRTLELLGKYTAGQVEGAQQEILTDGGWDGKAQPSGDFCHWLLWKMGCRDSRILSRNVPEANIQRAADGLCKKLCDGAQRLNAWMPFQLDTAPKPGDIVLSGQRKRGEQERARVFLAEYATRAWSVVDAWMDSSGRLRVCETQVELRGEELVRPGGRETLVGWVDLLAVLGDSAGPG